MLVVCAQQKEMTLLDLANFKVKAKFGTSSGSFVCGLVTENVVYGCTDKSTLIVFDKESGSQLSILSF